MKRADLDTQLILGAFADHRVGAWEWLTARCPRKVVMRAIEREVDRGYLNYGVCPERSWLTPEGRALLRASDTPMTSSLSP